MKTQPTLLFLALAVLLAACAPAPGEPTNACAAVLCPVGSTCEDGICYPSDATRCDDPRPEICTLEYAPVCGSDGQTYGNGCGACGNADVQWHVPGECNAPSPDYVACEDPRPEVCTREYNPVCATVDNGIRCVTQPCPSTDQKTYATDCTACADPLVYGYEPGACDPEVDNNPADDAPALEAKAYFICKTAEYDRTQMAAELDLECVESCSAGFDQYGGQIGLWCIPHAGQAELAAFTQCSRGDQCLTTERCAQASHATSGGAISWASEAESFRCVPEYYASYLLQTGGLTAIDENGDRTTAIA